VAPKALKEVDMARLLAIRCKISRGGFSGERVFDIAIANISHSGVGSRIHMWNLDQTPVDKGEPPLGQKIDGLIAVRVLSQDAVTATVSMPDGEVIDIPVGELLDRPKVDQHVSVG
jgi:hypothetical protein